MTHIVAQGSSDDPQSVDLQHKGRSASAMKDVWEAATTMDPAGHPYFVQKEIDPRGCQVRRYRDERGRDVLLLPLWHGTHLASIQEVYGNCEKDFWDGVDGWEGASNRFGPLKPPTKTVYICEGWATGWSIWRATGATVLVSYLRPNIAHVVERVLPKLDGHSLVIAADNDRWTNYYVGTEAKPNPGVSLARLVAAEHGTAVAIPDFRNLENKPTDFNDLRILEGLDAVRRWLDPAEAHNAQTAPPAAEEVGPFDNAPFLVRGVNGNRYVIVRRDTGAKHVLTANQLYRQAHLCGLASSGWWETFYDKEIGVEASNTNRWARLGSMVQLEAEKRRVSNHERSMGVWRERGGGIVVHCGDDLLTPDGEWVRPWLWLGGNYVQVKDADRAIKPFRKPAAVGETRDIHDAVVNFWRWKASASGYLVAGWLLLAPIANCLSWRPHIWVNGKPGCGKSDFLKIVAALCPFVKVHESGTTRASLLRSLGKEYARSCIIDELERPKDDVIQYIRTCSAGTGIQHARGMGTIRYRTESMFICASIARVVHSLRDQRRFSLCQMLPLDGTKEATGEYRQWRGGLTTAIDGGLPGRLLGRAVQMLRDGRLDRTIKMFRTVFVNNIDSAPKAEQFGALIAGAWLMQNDNPPDAFEAREYVNSLDWDEEEDLHGLVPEAAIEQEREGREVLSHILQTQVVWGPAKEQVSIRQLVASLIAGAENPTGDQAKVLRQWFIRVEDDDVLIGKASQRIQGAMSDSRFADHWFRVLANLPGATMPPARKGGRRSFGGVRTRIIRIPLDTFMDS